MESDSFSGDPEVNYTEVRGNVKVNTRDDEKSHLEESTTQVRELKHLARSYNEMLDHTHEKIFGMAPLCEGFEPDLDKPLGNLAKLDREIVELRIELNRMHNTIRKLKDL